MSVFPNIGGNGNSFFAEIPKRKWGRYFGELIDLNTDSLSMSSEESMDGLSGEEEDYQLEEQARDMEDFYDSEDVESAVIESGVENQEGEYDSYIEEGMEC